MHTAKKKRSPRVTGIYTIAIDTSLYSLLSLQSWIPTGRIVLLRTSPTTEPSRAIPHHWRGAETRRALRPNGQWFLLFPCSRRWSLGQPFCDGRPTECWVHCATDEVALEGGGDESYSHTLLCPTCREDNSVPLGVVSSSTRSSSRRVHTLK